MPFRPLGRRRRRRRKRKVAKKKALAYPRPFPATKKRCRLTWSIDKNLTSAAATDILAQIKCNDLFDPDYSNTLGNGQPLHFDTLLTASGPYWKYVVEGWTTIVEVQGHGGTYMVYYGQDLDSNSIDTRAEAQNWQGMQQRLLNTATNPVRIVKKNRLKNAIGYPNMVDPVEWGGQYNSSPSNVVYGNLIIHECTGAASDVQVKVTHHFDCVLYGQRNVAS